MTTGRSEGSLRIVRDNGGDIDPASNWFLAVLPQTVVAYLTPRLECVRLDRKQVLFIPNERIGHVHFPTTAIVSLVAASDSGETLEVGLIGRDGFAGAVALPGVSSMPCDGIVQFPGLAYRMDAGSFAESLRNFEPLAGAVARYAYLLLARSVQMQMCNMFHPVEQRLTRWLLTVNDLLASADVPLTHELLATILGVRRATVTLVVGQLRRAGLIEERRGRISIRDRDRLEAACCDCYRLMCEQQAKVLGYSCGGAVAVNF